MEPDEYRAALTDALVGEIRAEMGRRGIRSIRELAERAGMTVTAMQDRLNKNARTKRRTPISVPDLAAIGQALDVEPIILLRRAMAEVNDPPAPGRKVRG